MPTDEEPPHENHEEDGCIQNFDALIVGLMKSDAVTGCEDSVTTRELGMLMMHCKCLCDKGYQILLLRRNSYCKLWIELN
ncbi:hypothetical protein NC652_001790 [Populus alba x Populus x berolinensis]|nr:hypothetical protein NC652_001790 [Populus alba x Populus x berolinensis]